MAAKRALAVLAVIAGVGLVLWAFWPTPVRVDIAEARTAPMQVTVTAEGVTKVRDPYQVTAPLTGVAARSPVQVGDPVTRDETIVAMIQPARPGFLDARSRLQAEAAVSEAEAALRLAEANLTRAQVDLNHAETEYSRNEALAAREIIPQRMLDDTTIARDSAQSALAAAQSSVELQRATLAKTRAQLIEPQTDTGDKAAGACCVEVRAPQSGTVLSVENLSERLVLAGTPLLTVGDLADLEIEVDLLSSDAVKITPGARGLVERWGGDIVLEAQVRQVDPSGFTKVSALGIEEQRVRLRLDILAPPDLREGLGDNYRVFVRLVVWEEDAILQIPVSALFRSGGRWAVFREVNGRAVLTEVDLGRQTDLQAQILSGLSEGDKVVAFPGNEVEDQARIAPRGAE